MPNEVTGFVCEHCGRIYKTRRWCEKHEAICFQNKNRAPVLGELLESDDAGYIWTGRHWFPVTGYEFTEHNGHDWPDVDGTIWGKDYINITELQYSMGDKRNAWILYVIGMAAPDGLSDGYHDDILEHVYLVESYGDVFLFTEWLNLWLDEGNNPLEVSNA